MRPSPVELAKLIVEVSSGTAPSSQVTVGELLLRWVEHRRRAREARSPGQPDWTLSVIRKHFLPHVGDSQALSTWDDSSIGGFGVLVPEPVGELLVAGLDGDIERGLVDRSDPVQVGAALGSIPSTRTVGEPCMPPAHANISVVNHALGHGRTPTKPHHSLTSPATAATTCGQPRTINTSTLTTAP